MLAMVEYPQIQTVRAYAQIAECGLAVLRAVDITADNLEAEGRMLEALAGAGSALIDMLRNLENQVSPTSPALDDGGTLADALEVVADALRRRIALGIGRRGRIDHDPTLGQTQRDLLGQGYEKHLEALVEAESVIAALAGLLIGYELARESRSIQDNRFDSALELRKRILAS